MARSDSHYTRSLSQCIIVANGVVPSRAVSRSTAPSTGSDGVFRTAWMVDHCRGVPPIRDLLHWKPRLEIRLASPASGLKQSSALHRRACCPDPGIECHGGGAAVAASIRPDPRHE
ncbi:hypothetical protein NDU88_005282 [Pleurodeles waltl]|uniref:Uncharacterized protein n=1 Tax=Pleurodeles waltl TaxID=8319 RepID=A0AAV7MBN5_PLEWA|nr:hypothetical protein NDU88_005282 [Pleurodeles waltl]